MLVPNSDRILTVHPLILTGDVIILEKHSKRRKSGIEKTIWDFIRDITHTEFTFPNRVSLFVAGISLSPIHTAIFVIGYGKVGFDSIIKIEQIRNYIHKFSIMIRIIQIFI